MYRHEESSLETLNSEEETEEKQTLPTYQSELYKLQQLKQQLKDLELESERIDKEKQKVKEKIEKIQKKLDHLITEDESEGM